MPEIDPQDDRLVPVLRSLADFDEQPREAVLRSALRRMRQRRAGASTVNELLGAMAALVTGFARLLGARHD